MGGAEQFTHCHGEVRQYYIGSLRLLMSDVVITISLLLRISTTIQRIYTRYYLRWLYAKCELSHRHSLVHNAYNIETPLFWKLLLGLQLFMIAFISQESIIFSVVSCRCCLNARRAGNGKTRLLKARNL